MTSVSPENSESDHYQRRDSKTRRGKARLLMSTLQPAAGQETNGPGARQFTSLHLHRLKQMGAIQKQLAWAGMCVTGDLSLLPACLGNTLPGCGELEPESRFLPHFTEQREHLQAHSFSWTGRNQPGTEASVIFEITHCEELGIHASVFQTGTVVSRHCK